MSLWGKRVEQSPLGSMEKKKKQDLEEEEDSPAHTISRVTLQGLNPLLSLATIMPADVMVVIQLSETIFLLFLHFDMKFKLKAQQICNECS